MSDEQRNGSPLDYRAAARGWPARLRSVVLISIIIVLAISGWSFGPRLWRTSSRLYRQHQCAEYAASLKQVVYEEDERGLSPSAEIVQPPQQFHQKQDAFGICTARHPPACWLSFAADNQLFAEPTGATLFLHLRCTPSGTSRVVAIQRHWNGVDRQWSSMNIAFSWTVVAPGNWKSPPQWKGHGAAALDAKTEPFHTYSRRFRLYAGQPDPLDASHFTIRYEIDSAFGTIDGYLRDNDHLEFKVRDGPGVAKYDPKDK